jgi:hypothetical protein
MYIESWKDGVQDRKRTQIRVPSGGYKAPSYGKKDVARALDDVRKERMSKDIGFIGRLGKTGLGLTAIYALCRLSGLIEEPNFDFETAVSSGIALFSCAAYAYDGYIHGRYQ